MENKIDIYTDGACSGNPGKGGYAAILMCEGHVKQVCGFSEQTTNNQMELIAVIEGVKALKKPCKISIYSDSAYVVNAFNNKWIDKWQKNGFRATSGAVKNVELWQQLIELLKPHTYTFIKVKGHSDNFYNNECDKLAREQIKINEVHQ